MEIDLSPLKINLQKLSKSFQKLSDISKRGMRLRNGRRRK